MENLSKLRQNTELERAAKTRGASVGPLPFRGLIPALIALITFVVYLPTLQNGFVNWDDNTHLLENRHYRGLGWEQLRWMFTTCLQGSCMPLNWVTYGLDYVLWGMIPAGYHLTSVLFHVANAVLLYFLSLRFMRLSAPVAEDLAIIPIRVAAGFSALFFSLHPLQVEVVAWTVGREMALAAFFFILTLLCYLKAAENESAGLPRRQWMGAAWILYALSLLSKEAALPVPFALLVLDVYPLRRLGGGQGRWFGSQVRPVWWEKIPFLVLALAAAIRATLEKQEAGSFYPMAGFGLLPRCAQVLSSLAFYPWKTVVPTGFSPLYPVHPFTGLWNLPLLLSVAFVVGLTVVLFFARHRYPAGLAAWLFYVLMILPLSGIVAFGPYRAADRFSYVPSLGWAVLAGAGLFYCWRLWNGGRLPLRILVLTQSFAVLLVMALASRTWSQTQIWHDSERLWRHALAVDEKSSFAHNNLGVVLGERGESGAAMSHFRRALEIDPVHVRARTNLARFLALQGSVEEAIGHLHLVLKIEPTYADAHNNLGNILADRGESDEAIAHFRKALELNPELAMTHYNLARILAKKGNLEEALSHYRAALAINPEDADTYNNLGLLLISQGSLNEGIEQFRQALRVNPNYAKAYFNLGKVSAQQSRLDEAVQYFQQALRIEPDVAEIHENLARVLARQGKTEEAVKEYQEAVRLLKSRFQGGVVR